MWRVSAELSNLRRAVLVAALVLAPAAVAGQDRISASDSTNSLLGNVIDVAGGAMTGVEVYLAGTDRTTRTDARGRWRIVDPPPGARVVVARHIGYIPYMREVVVGSRGSDTLTLLLRRFPPRLSTVEVRALSARAAADAAMLAERLAQLRVGSGRLFTRDQILTLRPATIAELIFGVPGVQVTRTQDAIIAASTRAGVGILNVEGQQCRLQFYLNTTPIENEGVVTLDPMTFRSVEVYPQTVLLTGLPMRPDRCGAIVINTMRR